MIYDFQIKNNDIRISADNFLRSILYIVQSLNFFRLRRSRMSVAKAIERITKSPVRDDINEKRETKNEKQKDFTKTFRDNIKLICIFTGYGWSYE